MKRIVVAGLGLIGSRHAHAVIGHRGAELVAVVEPNAQLRDMFDIPGFASIEDVDVAVDGAILATPSNLHADHAVISLSRGWPCLIEKPIEVSLDAADRIVSASKRTGLPVLTGHHRRYHASIHRLREIVRDGEIGRPVIANALWAVRKPDAYFRGNWRAGAAGSPVMINLVHDIDILRFVLGEIVGVTATGCQPIRNDGRVESGVVALQFDNGAMASIAFADTCPSPWGFEAGTHENPNIGGTGEDCIWIAGTTGGVAFPSLTLWGGASDWSEAARPTNQSAPNTDPLAAQLDHFLAVLDGAAPLIDAQDARRTLAATLEVEAQIAAEIPRARQSG